MSALSEALPLALAAAIYPPALLVMLLLLTGEQPRRLVLAYFVGAALMVVSAGLIALAALDGAGATSQDSRSASAGVQVAVGLALLVLAVWLWRRRARAPEQPAGDDQQHAGRIAQWSHRATTSEKWSFALGVAMFLPSPLYLLAVQQIANSGSSAGSKVAAVLVCAAAVLILVECTLLALVVRPGSVAAALGYAQTWLARNGWTLAAVLAFAVGGYALAQGLATLS